MLPTTSATPPGKKEEDACVKVAVKLRPLVDSEIAERCQPCLFVTPGAPQVSIGKDRSQHSFTYDHVFGEGGAHPDGLFPSCVAGLVDGLFRGYNATVFAYGQTGSGKTYTMGSAFNPGGSSTGVIPNVMERIFSKVAGSRGWDFAVRVSFVEIHKEEIKDLLVLQHRPSRPAVSIREVAGGVCLAGAEEKEVTTKEEMMAFLEQGSLCRATASTSMNNRSSRSHAIFTITVEQRRQASLTPVTPGADNSDDEQDDAADADGEDDFFCAKMHLVDLAGSERAKRTQAAGDRLQEGIHINKGLLALGNVITALVDKQSHIPYRDSKLTRLLQDSLGGNSRTLMIACVSPADSNFEETLNTLRYADRARHIRNKPVVNRDPVTAQLTSLRQQVALLKAENTDLRRQLRAWGADAAAPPSVAVFGGAANTPSPLADGDARLAGMLTELEEAQAQMEELRKKNASLMQLQASSAMLRNELAAAEKERDSFRALSQQLLQHAGPQGEAVLTDGILQAASDQVLAEYVGRNGALQQHNQELQATISKLQHEVRVLVQRATGLPLDEAPAAGALAPPPTPLLASAGGEDAEEGEGEDPAMTLEFAEQQAIVDNMFHQMEQLQRVIDAKDSMMQQLQAASSSAPHLKAKYDQVVADLQADLQTAEKERSRLTQELQRVKAGQDEAKKLLVAQYHERIVHKEAQIKALRKKEDEVRQLQSWQHRQEQKLASLSEEIRRYKAQKVQLQRAAEAAQKQMQQLRQAQSREVLQLKKQSRKDAARLQQYEAMHAKQQAVLKRKTQEAEAARKRLKELTEVQQRNPRYSERAASAPAACEEAETQPNTCAPLLRNERSRREWLEKEIDFCNQVCELQIMLRGELALRLETAKKLQGVERRLWLASQHSSSPAAGGGGEGTPWSAGRASGGIVIPAIEVQELRAKAKELEAQIKERSEFVKELEERIVRAKMEEDARTPALDARRWTGVRTIVEARVLLRTLFKSACEHKVQWRELQQDCKMLQEQCEFLKIERDTARLCEQHARRQVFKLELSASSPLLVHPSLAGGLPTLAVGFTGAEAVPTATTDAEVDELLREVEVVRSIGSLAESASPADGEPGAGGTEASGSPQHPPPATPSPRAEGADVQMVDAQAAVSIPDDAAPDNAAPRDASGGETAYDTADEDDGGGGGDGDGDDDDDDQDDVDYVPGMPTPAVRRARARASAVHQAEGAPPPPPRVAWGVRLEEEDDVAGPGPSSTPAGTGLRVSTGAASSSRLERQGSGGSAGSAGSGRRQRPVDESHVLELINEDRTARGFLVHARLTLKVLKEELQGRVIGGELWKPKNKNKEQMLRDFLLWHEESSDAPSTSQPSSTTPFGRHNHNHRMPARPQSAAACTPHGNHLRFRPSEPGDHTPASTPLRANSMRESPTPSTPSSGLRGGLMSQPSHFLKTPHVASASRRPQVLYDRTTAHLKVLDAARWTPRAKQARRETEESQRRIQELEMRKSQHLLPRGGPAAPARDLGRRPSTSQNPVWNF